MARRTFLTSLLCLSLWCCRAAIAAIQEPGTVKGKQFPCLIDATLDDLARGLDEGLFTSVDLVRAYKARIDQVNGVFHAVTELNPSALTIAAALDAERAVSGARGPLHGVPVLIKNNIATGSEQDGAMNNTAGSYALLGATMPRDSFVTSKLRASGAIILGKANLSEWAHYRTTPGNSSNGWSPHGGQVLGAYFEHQDPSGSSSGSGVSTALGLAWAALGTETDGSIVSPSSVGSLVGIKPTVGLTSRDLVIPISHRQDSIGPMARTVKDAAYLLQAIAGVDANDNYTSAIPGGDAGIPDYVAACGPDNNALQGARLGVPSNVLELFGADHHESTSDEIAAFKAALKAMESEGATVIRGGDVDFIAAQETLASDAETILLQADFVGNLARYLSKLSSNPQNLKTLQDVRRFTQSQPVEKYPQYDTGIWDEALGSFNSTDPRAWAAYQRNLYLAGEGGLLGAIKRAELDAILLPTSFSPTWAAINGAPIITVPLGYLPLGTPTKKSAFGLAEKAENIPFGISFLGAHWTEEKLISLAYAFEQLSQARDTVPPIIIPSAEIGDFAGF